MKPFKIAVIPGDGIGLEVVPEGLKVARAAGAELETVEYDLGGRRYLTTGEVLPDTVLEELRAFDAILLGAVGAPEVPPGVLERGLLLRLRFELDLYVNLRPFVATSSVGAGVPIDIAVIRENTEGTYAGEGGFLRKGTQAEIATQGSVNTRFGVERCIRFAFDLAQTRVRRHLTLVHKTNVLTFSGDLWQRTFDQVALEYPEVTTAYNHIDAACIYCVESPQRYDVVVTDNLFGDILTDLAGAIGGGIGKAASGNLNPARTGPSMFEPVHGSAPDIAGTGRADPTAAIVSTAMMLDFLGASDPAGRITRAVSSLAGADLVPDLASRPPRSATPSPSSLPQKGCSPMPITKTEKIWMDGELVDWDDARIHILTHSLHYGLGVFEGIRAYATESGPGVFRLTDHVNRLFNSAKIFMIDIPFGPDEIVEAIKTTVRVNGLPECYIRPLVYLGYGEMGLNPLPCEVKVSIAVWPWGAYLGAEGVANGVRTKISSWQRHDPNAMPPAAKGTGMYINSSMAKIEALKAGYDEAILLSPQGYVSECTGENIFVVRGGRVITPPAQAGALEGVTQSSVMTIGRDLGFEMESGQLLRSDLYVAEEAFLSGTAAEVVPIVSVDDRVLGDGRPGPITRRIQEVFHGAVRGQIDRYKDWVEHVG